jgi:hypothetical protein
MIIMKDLYGYELHHRGRIVQLIKKNSAGVYQVISDPTDARWEMVFKPIGPDTLNSPGEELYANAICPPGAQNCDQDCVVMWSECTEKCELGGDRISTIVVHSAGAGRNCGVKDRAPDCKENHGRCGPSKDGGFIGYIILFVVIFLVLALIIYLVTSGESPPSTHMLVPPQPPPTLAAPAPAVR